MNVNANQSVWALDMCRIWSENNREGRGFWEEPMPIEEHWDFMFAVEDREGNNIYGHFEDVDEYLLLLLKPLFSNIIIPKEERRNGNE